ncbi:beta strand repeat-containing protein [Flavobacterium sp. XS2P39]|uniref:beta strand repeat-containing protein n=1 Tax=Flavobacterium sp. XS2P39 TaxID=3401725 RepID=UPI003AAFDF28
MKTIKTTGYYLLIITFLLFGLNCTAQNSVNGAFAVTDVYSSSVIGSEYTIGGDFSDINYMFSALDIKVSDIIVDGDGKLFRIDAIQSSNSIHIIVDVTYLSGASDPAQTEPLNYASGTLFRPTANGYPLVTYDPINPNPRLMASVQNAALLAISKDISIVNVSSSTTGSDLSTEIDRATAAEATKEDTANKSVDLTADGASDLKFPSVKAVKTYVDAGDTTAATNLETEATRATTAEGTKEDTANKSVDLTIDGASDVKFPSVKAVKTYVNALATADATTISKGKIQLAGELTGTAEAPTLVNDAVTGKVLTGFTSGTGAVVATDNILQAIEKLDGKQAAITLTTTGTSGASTLVGNTLNIPQYSGGTGDAATANPLSQFAATTSAQLAGVLGDETGTGAVMFSASPTLTGIALAPTPVVDTNTDQVATTAFVLGQLSSTTPIIDGTAAIGTGKTFARADHVHPTDTSRVPAAGSSSVTTLGTITSGTWNGTAIPVANGGTGATTASSGLNNLLPTQTANAGRVLQTDGANATWVTASTGDAATANPLSQFATTTSAQLAGVLSDETGTGMVVFSASPTLTGIALAPTPTFDTNTDQVATTAFVLGQLSSTTPIIDGTASAGIATTSSRADHVHPTDTLRAPAAGSSSITTLGTITSGTWNGTAISVANGGTGAITSSSALNNLLPTQTANAGRVLQTDGVNASWVTTSIGEAATANPLSQFATTTSAQLAGVLSDETGTGSVVFSASPTLITPNLGTPTVLEGTNITGTATGLTAGTVTTNADLTGEVTSSGNMTTVKNATVIGKVLTGFTSAAGQILTTDSILQAIEKLDGNLAGGISDATTISKGRIQLAGDLAGTAASPMVAGINGTSLAGLATGILKNNTTTGVPSIASVRTDYAEPTTVLATGILKNTNGSGQHTIALAADFPRLDQNTSGTAANVTGIVNGSNGGTGINNGLNTITLGGNFTTAGSYSTTLVVSANTAVNLPGSGTLATLTDVFTASATNANLTGPITSSGNATLVTSQTGTGSKFVMDNSPTLITPTLITPNLDTPTALVGTNITGTAAGLTAGTVTTNADLTGEVTSSGNATTVTNDAVIAKVLTGFSRTSGAITATDNILQAIEKLDGNLAAGVIDATASDKGIIQLAGDLAGTAATPRVAGINGTSLAGLSTGILKNTTATGMPSIATVRTDYAEPTSALPSGILKNTTVTGQHTIALPADFPRLDQNTSGTAANVTGTVSGANGGTGVNNGSHTITLGGDFVMAGPHLVTLSTTGETALTLPLSGTLATLDDLVAETTPDATTGSKGKIQLAGDLTGTAAAPWVTNAAVITKVLTGFASGSGAVSGTDTILGAIQKLDGKQTAITLTTTGTSGASTLVGSTLNIPQYAGSTGTVTGVSVTTANGISGTVTAAPTPALSLSLAAITPTSINGVVLSGAATPTLSVTGTTAVSGTNSGDNAVNITYESDYRAANFRSGIEYALPNASTSGTALNVSGIVAGANGGTGVANIGKTLTLGGNLTTTGPFASNITATAATAVTLPTSGTLATLDGVESLTNKSITGSSNGTSTIVGFNTVVNTVSATTYTLVQADNGKVLNFTNGSAITLTIPAGLSAGFNCLIVQYGAGVITLTGSGTAVVNKSNYTKTAGPYSIATIVSPVTNVFITSGNMN